MASKQMPAAQAIKLKGHEYIMRFHNMGISWEKSKLAALVLARELRENFVHNHLAANLAQDERFHKKVEAFLELERGIKAY